MISTFRDEFIINETMAKTHDSLRDTIRRKIVFWLSGSPFSYVEHPATNAVWRLTATDENDLKLDMAQLVKAPQDLIVIQASIIVGPGHQNTLGQLEGAERAQFLRNLQLRLLLMGLEFQGIAYPLERIIVQHFFFYDGLTKDAFFQKISLVRRAAFGPILCT